MRKIYIRLYRPFFSNKDAASYLSTLTGTPFYEFDPDASESSIATIYFQAMPGEIGKTLLTLSERFDTMTRTIEGQTWVWLDIKGCFFKD